jgi:hypothetical protein
MTHRRSRRSECAPHTRNQGLTVVRNTDSLTTPKMCSAISFADSRDSLFLFNGAMACVCSLRFGACRLV